MDYKSIYSRHSDYKSEWTEPKKESPAIKRKTLFNSQVYYMYKRLITDHDLYRSVAGLDDI